jgi:hypothetical protein
MDASTTVRDRCASRMAEEEDMAFEVINDKARVAGGAGMVG